MDAQRAAMVMEALHQLYPEAQPELHFANPYETLKQLTRTNSKVNAQTIADFVETLDVADDVKQRIRNITPHNYVGLKIK